MPTDANDKTVVQRLGQEAFEQLAHIIPCAFAEAAAKGKKKPKTPKRPKPTGGY